jgi:hypothetical protein
MDAAVFRLEPENLPKLQVRHRYRPFNQGLR